MNNQSLQLSNLDREAVENCTNWLGFHRLWGQLSLNTIEAIAKSVQILRLEANSEIYHQETKPLGLYLLKWGSVEIYRSSPVGRTHINYRNAGEIFGYVPLLDDQETAIYRASAVTVSKSEIWFLERDRLIVVIQASGGERYLSTAMFAK